MSRYHGDLPSHSFFDDSVARHLITAASIHEASHMMVAAMGGLPMKDMSVMLHVAGRQDMSASGVTRIDIEQELFEKWVKVSDEKALHWMTACAAGQTGEALWVEQCKPGFDRRRSLEYTSAGACSDHEMFHWTARKYKIQVTWEVAQANARRLLLSRWEWVQQEALKLYRTGRQDLRRVQAPR